MVVSLLSIVTNVIGTDTPESATIGKPLRPEVTLNYGNDRYPQDITDSGGSLAA